MKSLKELLQERASLVKQARDVLDVAAKEGRDLNADESSKYDKIDGEIDKLTSEIDGRKAVDSRREKLDSLRDVEVIRQTGDLPLHGENGELTEADKQAEELRRKAVCRYLAGLPLSEEQQLSLRSDTDERGGYIVMQEQMHNELLKDLDDEVLIRQLARKFTVTEAVSMSVPTRTAKASTWVWSSEVGEPTADTALKFGKRKLTPHYMTGEIDVSRDLLRAAVMSADMIVREELARDGGEHQEEAFMTGDGHEKPLGIFTASDDGIPTSRDVSEDNTATLIKADGLINAFYSLKPTYQRRSEWLFHRDAIKQVRKLKDGNGQYLWTPGLQAGQADTILNRPVNQSEFAPNTFTTGQYVGIIGDFSQYWIVDQLETLELLVLQELMARQNQVAYLGRMKVDGAPVRGEAFARVKLG